MCSPLLSSLSYMTSLFSFLQVLTWSWNWSTRFDSIVWSFAEQQNARLAGKQASTIEAKIHGPAVEDPPASPAFLSAELSHERYECSSYLCHCPGVQNKYTSRLNVTEYVELSRYSLAQYLLDMSIAVPHLSRYPLEEASYESQKS